MCVCARGGRGSLYTVAVRVHLHTESGRADVGLMFVHVSSSVCV